MEFAVSGAGKEKDILILQHHNCTPCLKCLALKAPIDPSPLLKEKRPHTMAVVPGRRKSEFRIDTRSLLPFAARRYAVAGRATCLDLRMAARTVAALFAAAMETIHTGYWKISSRAAINGYRCRRISSSSGQAKQNRISLNRVEKNVWSSRKAVGALPY